MNEPNDTRTDRQRIADAFKALRKVGYLARMNVGDCGSCSEALMGRLAAAKAKKEGREYDPKTVKAVWWHNQDDSAFDERHKWGWGGPRDERDGNLHHELCIRWQGNGHEIARALEHEGLTIQWDGTDDQCLAVQPRNPSIKKDISNVA